MTDNNSDGSNPSRMFINTNNPKVQDRVQKKDVPYASIKPSFPPLIDPKDLLIIGKDNKPSRSPNAFIIYRKVFFKTVRNEGHVLPMTVISSMASQSWEQEPDEVKKYYKRLAKEAYNYRIECFPKKVNRRKKRERWNIISFNDGTSISSSPSSTTNDQDVSECVTENLQLPTPVDDVLENPLIETFMQLNNALLQNIVMSNELLNHIKNQNVPQFNHLNLTNDHFKDTDPTELSNLQEPFYQCPSMDSDFSPDFNHYDDRNDILSGNSFPDTVAVELSNLRGQPNFPSPSPSLDDINNLLSPDLNELFNLFPIEISQQLDNDEQQPIEQEQFIANDLSQQILFPQSFTTNDNVLTGLTPFDDLNVFSDKSLPDCLDNLSGNDVTVDSLDDTIFSENSNLLQYQDGLGINTLANTEFGTLFSL